MAEASSLQARVQAAEEAATSNPSAAVAELRSVVVAGGPSSDAESLKVREAALTKLADLLVAQRDAAALRGLLPDLRPLFAAIPKAKTAKIVRTVIDSIARVPGSAQLLVRATAAAAASRRNVGPCAAAAAACGWRPRSVGPPADRSAALRVQSKARCTSQLGRCMLLRRRRRHARPLIPLLARARPPAAPQKEVCQEQVEWATAEKRTFLRQRIEIRLAQLHMELKDYPAALALISAQQRGPG